MSGHSKWSKIKRQKGAADHKRGQVFTKLGRTITIAAKQGGPDPDMNFKLRIAISKARQANMPKDNIERAIKRGSGDDGDTNYEELVYEGFGPQNGALIIEVLTDNKNRAVSQLKHILSKKGGSLAANGAVMWQFDHRGLISLNITTLTEEIEMQIMESGALDYELLDAGVQLITKPDELEKVKNELEKQNLSLDSAELVYIPKETQVAENSEAWEQFLEELEDLEDVNNVYTNVISDEQG